jgi:hypothetical protein
VGRGTATYDGVSPFASNDIVLIEKSGGYSQFCVRICSHTGQMQNPIHYSLSSDWPGALSEGQDYLHLLFVADKTHQFSDLVMNTHMGYVEEQRVGMSLPSIYVIAVNGYWIRWNP